MSSHCDQIKFTLIPYLMLNVFSCVCVCVAGMYFFSIVQALVDWGYTRDDDVRGAPYDWRKAPSKLPHLKNQAETWPEVVHI